MAVVRTISAILIALSVAFATIAAVAAPVPAQMSMSDGSHDCCPEPCDMSKNGCMSMVACVATTVFSAPASQDFLVPLLAAEPLVLPFSEAPPSRASGPPLRPPQA
jgi:hypothetical protein